jgi:hypothetical protein
MAFLYYLLSEIGGWIDGCAVDELSSVNFGEGA